MACWVRRRTWSTLYELLTGHPDRAARELVLLPNLTVELRTWPADIWRTVGIDRQQAARAAIAGWRRGELPGVRLGGLSAEKALSVERPAMTLVHVQLADQLGRQYRGLDERVRPGVVRRRPDWV